MFIAAHVYTYGRYLAGPVRLTRMLQTFSRYVKHSKIRNLTWL